jgi:hypothetical protein
MFSRFLTLPAILGLGVSCVQAADWPNFRGPSHNGISAEKGWRANWPGEIPVAWKAEVGLGFS